MNKVWQVLKVVLFIGFGIFLLWLVFKDFDFSAFWQYLKKVHFWAIGLMATISIFSHYIRAIRWKLLIEGEKGIKVRSNVLFYSVLIMYLTNFALPRSGEVIRCGTVSKYEKVSFAYLLGTVVTERAVDLLAVILITLLGLMLNPDDFAKLFEIPEIKTTINTFINSTPKLIAISVVAVGLLILAFVFREKLAKFKLIKKLYEIGIKLWNGIKTVFSMEKKVEFILLTIFLWGLYYLMMRIAFYAFDFTSHLNWLDALFVFVFSNFGMLIPSPGGLGSWHYMVKIALGLLGIEANLALSYALTVHESQMFLLILAGFLAIVAISLVKPVENPNSKIDKNEQET